MEAPLATSLRRRSTNRRRRRAVLLVGLAVAFITAAVFFLDNSGSSSLTISPAPGTTSGSVASVVTSGLSQVGKAGQPVAKITVAKDYVKNSDGRNVRITVAWTNASNSALNGKDVIGVGLYYPIWTNSSSSGCSGSNQIMVQDTNLASNQYVCLQQDTSATGTNVDTGSGDTYYGLIPIVASLQTGTFLPGTSPGTPSSCTTSGSAWCLMSTDTSSTRTMYLVASVLNPAGHAPPGQQPSPGQITFFVQAEAMP